MRTTTLKIVKKTLEQTQPLLLAALLCLPGPLSRAVEMAPASKPNIVLILIDDMGYADTGFNGCLDILTPNIDQLAKRGAILDDFYAQPVCSPGRPHRPPGQPRVF